MFNLIVDNYKTQYFAQPALAAKHEDVKKKIVLLCLLNIAFEKPSYDRNILFTEIANKTRIPVDQVRQAWQLSPGLWTCGIPMKFTIVFYRIFLYRHLLISKLDYLICVCALFMSSWYRFNIPAQLYLLAPVTPPSPILPSSLQPWRPTGGVGVHARDVFRPHSREHRWGGRVLHGLIQSEWYCPSPILLHPVLL